MKKLKIYKKFLLIIFFLTIIYYSYNLYFNTGIIKITDQEKTEIIKNIKTKKETTSFKNVEYRSKDFKKKFIITGEEAIINKKEKDIVNLKKVKSYVTLKDKSQLQIFSDHALYDQEKKNIFFKGNVRIFNKDYNISSKKASYISKKNLIEINDDVIFKKKFSIIYADLIKVNTIKNSVEILTNSKNKKVYGRTQD